MAEEGATSQKRTTMNSNGTAGEQTVGVSYYGAEFVLTVARDTEPGTSDDERARAASEWFADIYGFSPADHATRISVQPLPQPDGRV
jgi:hypothetical protein